MRAPSILALVLVAACGAPATVTPPATPSTTTTAAPVCAKGHVVALVRHAEKDTNDPKDPDLSERGHARARSLGEIFAKAGVTRLVATNYKRTQQTLAPLAAKTGLSVETRAADRSLDLARELSDAKDGTFTVVATHSNVLPMLVRKLGGELSDLPPNVDALAEDDYARVVLVVHSCGATKPSVVELSSP